MRVLGIETTCDETAAAVVALKPDGGGAILSNEVLSQIALHAAYGGVVPEIAARAHLEVIDKLVVRAMEKANLNFHAIDAVAAAGGPGLIGGVMIGLTTAKALALALRKPFVAVNHLAAHVLTPRLTENVQFPYLALLVSGGHTQIAVARDSNDFVRLGTTIDDALGEAFDKVAKLLGLGYPGGPLVEREAASGDPERFAFPRPMAGRPTPDFSFSGLKTAVRLEADKIKPMQPRDIADICASFQAAVVDTVIDRMRAGLRLCRAQQGAPTALAVVGGVAANAALRRALQRFAAESGVRLVAPPVHLCGDNAAMIAWAAIERLQSEPPDDMTFAPRARWPLDARMDINSKSKA